MPSIAMTSALPHLHSRAARPQFYNKPKFLLAPDPKYAPPILCTEPSPHVQFMPRPPFSALSNQQFSVITSVEGKWSRAKPDASTTTISPQTFRVDSDIIPLPPTLEDILRMEPELSPRSALQRASDVPSSVAQALLDSLKDRASKARKSSNPRKRKVQTPFPPHHDDRSDSTRVLEGAAGAPRKRTRKGMRTNATSPATTKVLKAIQHQREEFRPLVEWLASTLFGVIVFPSEIEETVIDEITRQSAIDMILDILLTYMPENTIILSALWYICRLFPVGIVPAHNFAGPDAVELTVRVFVLGLLLAWKWLHDTTIKASSWMAFVSLPCESINKFERSALKILDYDIRISPGQWESWLIFLQNSTCCFPPAGNGNQSASAVINDLLSSAQRVHGEYHPEPIAPPTSSTLEQNLYCQATEGLFNGKQYFRTRQTISISEPAPWNPAADAIVTPPRYSRKANIVPSVLSRRITAADVLATIVADLPVRAYYEDYGAMPALHYSYGYGSYPIASVG